MQAMSVALLYLVPSLLLLAVLLLRRYPGEGRLAAIAESRSPRARRAAPPRSSRPRPRAFLPRGGLLIGAALAVRPPPGVPVPA
jgi:hypothetical protein